MKRIIAIFTFLMLLSSLCACQKTHTPDKTSISLDTATIDIGESHTDFEGVNIKIKNVIWDEENIKLEVDWINETKYEVTYGEIYAIKLESDGEWVSRQKNDELTFILPAYILKSGDTQKKIYNLTDVFDITENGKYRLITDCSVYDKGNGGESKKCNLWAEFTVTHKGDTGGEVKKTFIDFKTQYIRTNGYHEEVKYPLVKIIRSTQELDAYYNTNKGKYDLERHEKVYSDTTIGFLDACDKYDKAYFEKQSLIMVLIEEGSGSVRHNVNSVKVDTNSKFYVNINSIVPETGTGDMAQWHIIIEIAKEYCPNSSNDVAIYMDDKLITDADWHTHQPTQDAQTESELISGYCGNTQTTIYFDNNKSYTFMYGESVTMTDILANLEYDTKKFCNCSPEYKVDTELGKGYGINITEGYARCNKGQAELTKEQIEKLEEIILWAKDNAE